MNINDEDAKILIKVCEDLPYHIRRVLYKIPVGVGVVVDIPNERVLIEVREKGGEASPTFRFPLLFKDVLEDSDIAVHNLLEEVKLFL